MLAMLIVKILATRDYCKCTIRECLNTLASRNIHAGTKAHCEDKDMDINGRTTPFAHLRLVAGVAAVSKC
jgi:hypothetical protein